MNLYINAGILTEGVHYKWKQASVPAASDFHLLLHLFHQSY